MVGVEHKKLGDLFQCLRDGRLADQIRLMRQTYTVSWLLIQGRMQGVQPGTAVHVQSSKTKRFRQQPGHMTYQEIAGKVLTLCQAGGILLWQTESQEESVQWLRSLNIWWTAKDWEEHRAHLDFYTPEAVGGNPLEQPRKVAKTAVTLPSLRSVKAARAAEHFSTIHEMVNASMEEWQKIKGVGTKDAATIFNYVRTP